MCIRDRDKVVVVERSGEYLKTHAEDSEALFLALVKKTCAEATGYANSFDRLNPVSYTHLDVYKRQKPYIASNIKIA